jgi:hypothetical protein
MKKLALPLVLMAALLLALPSGALAGQHRSAGSLAAHLKKAESALLRADRAVSSAGRLHALRRADRNATAAVREARLLEAQGSLPPELGDQLATVVDRVGDALLTFTALVGQGQNLVPSFGLTGLISPVALVMGNLTTAKLIVEGLLRGHP